MYKIVVVNFTIHIICITNVVAIRIEGENSHVTRILARHGNGQRLPSARVHRSFLILIRSTCTRFEQFGGASFNHLDAVLRALGYAASLVFCLFISPSA